MGTQLPAEGFVHISALSDDYYKFDKSRHVIKGHTFRSGSTGFRLGDAVHVAVAAVDVERRELDFRMLKKLGSPIGDGFEDVFRSGMERSRSPRKPQKDRGKGPRKDGSAFKRRVRTSPQRRQYTAPRRRSTNR